MRARVEDRLADVRVALGAHAGGIELVGVADGVVTLRYTGMCTGCPLRPLTTASTVRPALQSLAGVTAVEVEGSRISEEAERRLAAYFGGKPLSRRASPEPTSVSHRPPSVPHVCRRFAL